MIVPGGRRPRAAALREAAGSLQASLQDCSWFMMVGVGVVDGDDGLIVYAARGGRSLARRVPGRWEGFPVAVRIMSRPVV